MRQCKLVFHQKTQLLQQQKTYAGEELAFCPKDFAKDLNLKEDDVVEIRLVDDPRVSFVLKVTKGSLRDDYTPKDTVSIDSGIASAFQLKNYCDVFLSRVEPQSLVELDSVEFTFKDQYLGRSEMWRLRLSLEGCSLYLGKKVEFCGNIRCQVHELWSGGATVRSGLVTEATKIVYRSLTSMVYLFIQMSSEMWEFDICGDLYFEKAVNGFLSELFTKWKKNGTNHEVTIVMFSRLYYYANSIDSFPEDVRVCLLTDYKGRFYEDFYRVVVQNEKYEDWTTTLINLRQVFVDYHEYLLNFHKSKFPNKKMPKAYISSAAQGNFLEVLNMSLNVFEKHFVDRSFDRTGQLSVVITPGVGVFEVDRDLTNVTMQRVIDNGVGSDLVCVGEQPLHAVPLLKFHNKATHHDVDDYSMPHWINLSFYATTKRVGYATFIPRIKLPTRRSFRDSSGSSRSINCSPPRRSPMPAGFMLRGLGDDSAWPNSIYDLENYDDSIFKPTSSQLATKRRLKQTKRPRTFTEVDFNRVFTRQNSEPEITAVAGSESSNNSGASSSAITIPSRKSFPKSKQVYSSSFGALNIEPAAVTVMKPRVALTPINDRWITDDVAAANTTIPQHNQSSPSMSSSHGESPPRDKDYGNPLPQIKARFPTTETIIKKPSRSLINPFDPSHAVIKLTSNRRRWTHIFPKGPMGTFIQQHHFSTKKTLDIVPEGEVTTVTDGDGTQSLSRHSIRENSLDGSSSTPTTPASAAKKVTRLWGATGEQEWSPALTTGVDWKSLTIPACLPLTTDYFPDERSLQTDYLVSDYNLLPDDVNADYSSQTAVYRRPLTTSEVFLELLSQRLAQGFQCVLRSKQPSSKQPVLSSGVLRLSGSNNGGTEEEKKEYFLSIGRIFHQISLSSSTITVTRYRPRHPYPAIKVHYKYRFYAPNNNNYEVSYADFSTEKLENYNWSYLDHYVCTRGDRDFALTENLKYWRFRMLIFPSIPTTSILMKKVAIDPQCRMDLYEVPTLEDKRTVTQEFVKFIETGINRIRRPNNSIPKGPRGGSGGSLGVGIATTGVFRERVNSNQLTSAAAERPRMRSGSSKLMDKQRHESGRVSPFDGTTEFKPGNLEQLTEGVPSRNHSGNSNGEDGGGGGASSTSLTSAFRIKSDATYQDIVTAMRSQTSGFSFIKSSELPHYTFVSYDAVTWLLNNMDGINSDSDAIEMFNKMLNEGYILHASGDINLRFIKGFYLYYITSTDTTGLSMEPLVPPPQYPDHSVFQNEWMEVMVPCDKELEDGGDVALSSCSHPTKTVFADVDLAKKSDRQEWGHARYQTFYHPDEAFELQVLWVQATGAIVHDLVQGWARKAPQCNLQLIPVPTDPFALPNSINSDPLRGPISIKVATKFLQDDGETVPAVQKIMRFQHAVAIKFGFLKCLSHSPASYSRMHSPLEDIHYIHTSGNMFLIVPICDTVNDIAFLWAWNYLISKRWRTPSTPALADDPFMFRVLHDLKAFSANEDNRLLNFWNEFNEREEVD